MGIVPFLNQKREPENAGRTILTDRLTVQETRYFYDTNQEDVPKQILVSKTKDGKVYRGAILRGNNSWNSNLKRWEAKYQGYLYCDPSQETELVYNLVKE